MRILFTEDSEKDLASLDSTLRKFFIRHAEKACAHPPGRHMKFGMPYFVDEVTRQARLVYEVKGEALFVIRCFAAHKEYERWYKSFK